MSAIVKAMLTPSFGRPPEANYLTDGTWITSAGTEVAYVSIT